MPAADLPPQPSFTVEEAPRAEEEATGLVSGSSHRLPYPNPGHCAEGPGQGCVSINPA